MNVVGREHPVICWWSGGVTSAVACWLAIMLYGVQNVRVVFIDTFNEDSDTYRFLQDCEKWYGCPIERISNPAYENIRDVWFKFLSLNVAQGAICSSELKRAVRLKFQKENKFSYQVFGFDILEPKRADAMTLNYESAFPVYPLLFFGYRKQKCMEIIMQHGISVPRAYKLGLNNNNCLKTGCVQGGIGYWQLLRIIMPDVFETMAKVEHDLTNLKGSPVTMLRSAGSPVFLLPHPQYPELKDISMLKGRPPKPLIDCNGHCGINDLTKRNPTEKEINYNNQLL